MSTHARAWPPGSGPNASQTSAHAFATAPGRHRRRLRTMVLSACPRAAAGMRRRLERLSAVEVLESVHTFEAAVDRCARARIDVVVAVFDAKTVPARELAGAASIRTRFPATRVVMALGNPHRLCQSLGARPDGLLAAAAPALEVADVVGTAAAGHLAVGRSLRDAFFRACAPAGEAAESPLDELTPRELQIIAGGARGLTSREIAKELHLAINTVDKALTVIYRKLRARNRTEACLIAARRGLLP